MTPTLPQEIPPSWWGVRAKPRKGEIEMSMTPGTPLHFNVTKYGQLVEAHEMKDPRGRPLTLKVYFYQREFYSELWYMGYLLSFDYLFE